MPWCLFFFFVIESAHITWIPLYRVSTQFQLNQSDMNRWMIMCWIVTLINPMVYRTALEWKLGTFLCRHMVISHWSTLIHTDPCLHRNCSKFHFNWGNMNRWMIICEIQLCFYNKWISNGACSSASEIWQSSCMNEFLQYERAPHGKSGISSCQHHTGSRIGIISLLNRFWCFPCWSEY